MLYLKVINVHISLLFKLCFLFVSFFGLPFLFLIEEAILCLWSVNLKVTRLSLLTLSVHFIIIYF